MYLAKRPDLPALNKAILYIRANENTQNVVIAHLIEGSPVHEPSAGQAEVAYDSKSRSEPSLDSSAIERKQMKKRFAAEQLVPEGDLVESAASGTVGPNDVVQLEGPAAILQEQVMVLDALYPKIKIDFLCISGTQFGPDALKWLADYVEVSINSIFIGAPDSNFAHQVAALGGVRVITKPTRNVIDQKFRPEGNGDDGSDSEGLRHLDATFAALGSGAAAAGQSAARANHVAVVASQSSPQLSVSVPAAGGAAAAAAGRPATGEQKPAPAHS